MADPDARLEFMARTPTAAGAAAQAAGSSLTKFTVDPDEAENFIKGLVKARDELEILYDQAVKLVNVNSPGKDIYSGFATAKIRQVGGDEEGGYRWSNLKGQEALSETIENIQKALDKYRETDGNATDAFKR